MRIGRHSFFLLLGVLLSFGLPGPVAYAQDNVPESDPSITSDAPAETDVGATTDDPAPPESDPADGAGSEDEFEPAPPPVADVVVDESGDESTLPAEAVEVDATEPSGDAQIDPASLETAPAETSAPVSTDYAPEPGDAEIAALALESVEGENIALVSLEDAELEPEMEAAVDALTEGEAPSDVTILQLPGLVTNTDTPENVVAVLVGTGITFENINFVGAEDALGQFSGGLGVIGFDAGIIMGSGNINDVVGPNVSDGITTQHGLPGDADLDALVEDSTQDAAVLTFDFVPSGNVVQFEYVFASDEYNEFVGSQFNDVFAFFINGVNCATIDGALVSVNSINLESNSTFYRNNDLEDGGGSINTEMDGLTTVLTCTASVIPGQSNTIKLAIADRGDTSLDSNVFIRASSFVVVPPPDPDPDPGTPPDPGTVKPPVTSKPPVQPATLSTGGTTGSIVVTGLPNTGAGETDSASGSAFLILTLISGTLAMLAVSRVVGHRAHAQ